jgi:hypothetical protein
MRWLRQLLIGLALCFVAGADAHADKRVALVIGNSAYSNVEKLANPANDASAVAGLLRSSGFDQVELYRDLGVNDLRRVIRDFAQAARDSDIAVVFYAGHGMEVDGVNYLIPVDARLETDLDVEDESVSIDRVLRVIDPAKRLRLVILDACRDNPFLKRMKRSLASRGTSRGLAQVEPASSDTLIAFAAKAGSVAVDGVGANSPFTAALVKHLAEPGLDLRIAFGRVRDEVLRSTARRQEPFVYGSLGGATVALVPAPEPKLAIPLPPPPDPEIAMRRDYELAEKVGTKEVWDAFLGRYATGFYADLARGQREKLAAEAARRQAMQEALRKDEERRKLAEVDRQKVEQNTRLQREDEQRRAQAAEADRQRSERDKAALEAARVREETQRAKAAEKPDEPREADNTKMKVAALPPDQRPEDVQPPKIDSVEIARLLHAQLKRVGCDPGNDGDAWGPSSRRALEAFNKHARAKLEVKVASLDALEAVRSKASRVCPLVCGRGYRAEGEHCVAITCRAGFILGPDGECQKRKEPPKPVVRAEPKPQQPASSSPAPRGGGKCFAFNGKQFCE